MHKYNAKTPEVSIKHYHLKNTNTNDLHNMTGNDFHNTNSFNMHREHTIITEEARGHSMALGSTRNNDQSGDSFVAIEPGEHLQQEDGKHRK